MTDEQKAKELKALQVAKIKEIRDEASYPAGPEIREILAELCADSDDIGWEEDVAAKKLGEREVLITQQLRGELERERNFINGLVQEIEVLVRAQEARSRPVC